MGGTLKLNLKSYSHCNLEFKSARAEIFLRVKMINISHVFLPLWSPFQCIFPEHQLYLVMTEQSHCWGLKVSTTQVMAWTDLTSLAQNRWSLLRESDRGLPTKASLFYTQRVLQPKDHSPGARPHAPGFHLPSLILSQAVLPRASQRRSVFLRALSVLSVHVPWGCSSGQYCVPSPQASGKWAASL